MTELFRTYEEEFIKTLALINTKIQSIAVQTNHKKQIAFADIKADLTQCEKALKLMETECVSLPVQPKFDSLRKIRQYKKDYDNSRKSLFKAEDDYATDKNREMLMGAQLDDMRDGYNDKLIRNGQALSDTTYKLKESVGVMHQNLEISDNIGRQIISHTGRIRGNKDKLGGIQGDLSKSQKLIKTMMGRIRRNKFILFSVLGVIFLIIIIVLGVHFSKVANTPDPNPPVPTPPTQ